MKKEVIGIFLVVLLLVMPFSSAQLNAIEIEDVNINDNIIQILIYNKLDKNFNKITFIINNQYTIIQDELLKAFETKFFVVNYPSGIKLETIKVIVGDQSIDYVFIGNEDTFVINQVVSQTSELTQVESNAPISYIYSGQRLAKIQDNQIVYFSSDNIGSTSLETDSSGNVNFKANYLPFGKELSFSSIGKEKYGFTSKEYDQESLLNYFNAIYYNPSNGKFISNDPIFKPSEGGYQYVRNNPLIITDPSGNDNTKIENSISYIFNTPPKNLLQMYGGMGRSLIEGDMESFKFYGYYYLKDLQAALIGLGMGGDISGKTLLRGDIRRWCKDIKCIPTFHGSNDPSIIIIGELHGNPLHKQIEREGIALAKPGYLLHEFLNSRTYNPKTRKIRFLSDALVSEADKLYEEESSSIGHIIKWSDEFEVPVIGTDLSYRELSVLSLDYGISSDATIIKYREKRMGQTMVQYAGKTDKPIVSIMGRYHMRPKSEIHPILKNKGINYVTIRLPN